MGSKDRAVLATKHACDLGREPTENEAFCIDYAPNAVEFARLG
jgi:hypothetical protein